MRRLLACLLFATLALASCGGGDDTENVQDLLDKAFSSSMNCADLKLDASIQLKGSPALDKPVRITASAAGGQGQRGEEQDEEETTHAAQTSWATATQCTFGRWITRWGT